jgi:hypothetical protein
MRSNWNHVNQKTRKWCESQLTGSSNPVDRDIEALTISKIITRSRSSYFSYITHHSSLSFPPMYPKHHFITSHLTHYKPPSFSSAFSISPTSALSLPPGTVLSFAFLAAAAGPDLSAVSSASSSASSSSGSAASSSSSRSAGSTSSSSSPAGSSSSSSSSSSSAAGAASLVVLRFFEAEGAGMRGQLCVTRG